MRLEIVLFSFLAAALVTASPAKQRRDVAFNSAIRLLESNPLIDG